MILSEQEIDAIVELPYVTERSQALRKVIPSHRAQSKLIEEMRQVLRDHGLGWHFKIDNPPTKDKGQIEDAAELSNSQAT